MMISGADYPPHSSNVILIAISLLIVFVVIILIDVDSRCTLVEY
jgi:hypothetical protein